MGEINVDLDNRIFALQQTKNLPDSIRQLVQEADRAYLQDRDSDAYQLIGKAESECAKLGIAIVMF